MTIKSIIQEFNEKSEFYKALEPEVYQKVMYISLVSKDVECGLMGIEVQIGKEEYSFSMHGSDRRQNQEVYHIIESVQKNWDAIQKAN